MIPVPAPLLAAAALAAPGALRQADVGNTYDPERGVYTAQWLVVEEDDRIRSGVAAISTRWTSTDDTTDVEIRYFDSDSQLVRRTTLSRLREIDEDPDGDPGTTAPTVADRVRMALFVTAGHVGSLVTAPEDDGYWRGLAAAVETANAEALAAGDHVLIDPTGGDERPILSGAPASRRAFARTIADALEAFDAGRSFAGFHHADRGGWDDLAAAALAVLYRGASGAPVVTWDVADAQTPDSVAVRSFDTDADAETIWSHDDLVRSVAPQLAEHAHDVAKLHNRSTRPLDDEPYWHALASVAVSAALSSEHRRALSYAPADGRPLLGIEAAERTALVNTIGGALAEHVNPEEPWNDRSIEDRDEWRDYGRVTIHTLVEQGVTGLES